MTQITRNGFVNKNGDKVILKPIVPGATPGNLAEFDTDGSIKDSGVSKSSIGGGGGGGSVTIDSTPTAGSNNAVSSGGVYTELEKKMDKPVVPALSKDYLAQFDGNGNVKKSAVKVADLAPVSHTHEVGDITGLNLHTKDVCLYENMASQGAMIMPSDSQDQERYAQEIDEEIACIKSIISGAVNGTGNGLVNTRFYANIYYGSQSFGADPAIPDANGYIHVWSKSKGSSMYDFNIEVLEGNSVIYTTVLDVEVSNSGIDYENVTFAEEWEVSSYIPAKDMADLVTPKSLILYHTGQDDDTLGNSSGNASKVYKSCEVGRVYPVLVTIDDRDSTTANPIVLGSLIVESTGSSESAKMTIYIGNYKVNVTADDAVTRGQIIGGSVEEDEVVWEANVVDYSSIF